MSLSAAIGKQWELIDPIAHGNPVMKTNLQVGPYDRYKWNYKSRLEKETNEYLLPNGG